MERVLDVALVMVVIATAGVLFTGVFGMMRVGSSERSQRLMRWRVALQALALVLVAGLMWVRH
ncbi:twin transmembrane helix small protein [Siculibacillus lacustris]|uniref:Twin transmembrane helix small protein n=1 Tax=Siculibacillus lacustris TaxID=1549641 RepID=A0A4Q9VUR8_9HYPH|nr:twin transmembrane helix small protein [Siculibacillus lacustris]TBW39965.1 twin transmembrane helix small protein [Siculibacillus lacustris]